MATITYTANGVEHDAWSDNLPDGRTRWVLSEDGSVIAEVFISMERYRRRDLSGMKEFRVIHKAHCQIVYRIGYGQSVTMSDDYLFYGGEIAAVRQLYRIFAQDSWPLTIEFELERQCREAGISDRETFMARYATSYGTPHRFDAARRLYRLLEKVKS